MQFQLSFGVMVFENNKPLKTYRSSLTVKMANVFKRKENGVGFERGG